ncbi:MAG: isoquinoline 1-oxidoreductase beta subunit [Halioglobus sp.]|jgi:isoquinoline 1-oxidoreductase beta subunit
MKNLKNISLNRRAFLGAGLAAGAMVLSVSLPSCTHKASAIKTSQQLNAFVILEPDGSVTVLTPFVEMGQGVHTAIPMLVAEELDISMDRVNVREAPLGSDYRLHFGGNVRYTGSSLTIKDAFIPFRQAGATARAMLLQSASREWNVPFSELTTSVGQISHHSSGRKAAYGKFVVGALHLTPPTDVPLKNHEDFLLIGTPADRLDAAEKTYGSALFGIDVAPPGLLVATVKQSPIFGGNVRQLDKEAALKMPGVVSVEVVPNGTNSISDYAIAPPDHKPKEILGTVAVIADSFWHAKKALEEVTVVYEGGAEQFSDQAFSKQLKSRVHDEGIISKSTGDFKTALTGAASSINAVYEVPFLAHMTMEPMNCTVLFKDAACTVWTGHQDADWIARIAAKILAIGLDRVNVITPYLGGGFGRRSNNDYVVQAVSLAKKLPGRPIKLIWSREEDIQHDFYRPKVLASFQAGFDADGNPTAYRHLNIGDGGQRQHGLSTNAPALMDSAVNQPYAIPNKSIEYLIQEIPIPIGFWRSVSGAHNGFFIESFMDEMADAVGEDPLSFRLRLLNQSPRFEAVLKLVAEMADWRGKRWQADDGSMHAMGIALHQDHYTIAAEIAEVSVNKRGHPVVHKVWCAVDCGTVVNPSIATMQIESGVAFGLSAALMEKVEINGGKVSNNNFYDYPVLTAQQMPDIEVQFIDSDAPPTGLGEPATPPIPAALCNALFTLTGKRIRTLPIGRVEV